MKVLIINSVCGICSTGRICTDLAEVLETKGHECKIAYGRETVPEKLQKYAVRIGNDLNVKIDGIKTRIFDNAGFNSVSATKKFLKWVAEYDPDIIHLHNIHGYYINIHLLFAFLKAYGKPVVWSLHDCWSFTGHCSHYSADKCYKWQTVCDECHRKHTYPRSVFLNRARQNFLKKAILFRSLDNLTLVTPSAWLANEVKNSFLNKYNIHPIPNGVDLEAFRPRESDFRDKYGLENKKIVLGVATAWEEYKGAKRFAELSQKLGDDYKVVLVGMTARQSAEMPSEILVLPRTVNISELCEIYTAADIFLNLSEMETMGLTTVEAMACGTPVCVSNFTATPEVVTDMGGIVLEDLKNDTIVKGIETVLSKDYPETRRNALKYEKNLQYNKYLELYEEIYKTM